MSALGILIEQQSCVHKGKTLLLCILLAVRDSRARETANAMDFTRY